MPLIPGYERKSDWALGHFNDGVAKGLLEGRVLGARDALRALAKARGIVLSAAGNQRIDGCSDLPTLEAWHLRAANASEESAIW